MTPSTYEQRLWRQWQALAEVAQLRAAIERRYQTLLRYAAIRDAWQAVAAMGEGCPYLACQERFGVSRKTVVRALAMTGGGVE